MSIKNKDLQGSSSDVVKSQLTSAIEDGVTGYGEKPDTTEILEQSYIFHVNDSSNYAPTDSTDGNVNKDAINKVASIQIDNQEIERVKDKLDASYLEENIEAQIVVMILGLINDGSDQSLKDAFESIKTKCAAEIKSAGEAMVLASRLFHAIQMYEMTLAKGNLLNNVPAWTKATEPFSTIFLIPNRAYFAYDPYVLYNTDMGEIINSTPTITTDITKKIMRCLSTEDVDTVEDKTLTTLMTQMGSLAEFAMTMGVSERFFKRVLGDDLDGGETTAVDYHTMDEKAAYVHPSNALCFIPSAYKVYSFSDEDAPPRMSDIFSKGAMGDRGPLSRPDLRAAYPGVELEGGNVMLDILLSEMESNFQDPAQNPINRIPAFCDSLSKKEKIIYLSTILGRELTLSRGISVMADPVFRGHFHDAVGTPIDAIYGSGPDSGIPICRGTGTSLGSMIFRPCLSLATTETPTHSKGVLTTPNEQSRFHSLLLRNHPDSTSSGPPQGFMPLEVLPAGMDTMSLIGQNSTLKTVVTEKIYENPKNIDEPLQVHLDYLDDLSRYGTAASQTMARLNAVQTQEGEDTPFEKSNIASKIVRKAIRDIGTMVVLASELSKPDLPPHVKTESRAALSNLVALTKFFKPNSIATDSQRFMKSDFLRRMVIVDMMMDTTTVDEPDGIYQLYFNNIGSVGVKGTDGPLGYSNSMKHAFQHLNPGGIVTQGNLGIYNFSPSYFGQLDGFNTEKYKTGAERTYPDLEQTEEYTFSGIHPKFIETKIFSTELFKCTSDQNPLVNIALLGTSDEASNLNIVDAALKVGWANSFGLGKSAASSEEYGYVFINHVWGPTPGGGNPTTQWSLYQNKKASLMARVLETAKMLQEEALLDSYNEQQTFAVGGVTAASGMDKADLLAIVLEIYSTLAEEFLKSVFICSAFSTAFNHIFGEQDGLSMTAVTHHDFDQITTFEGNTGYKHYYAIAPKISTVNIIKGAIPSQPDSLAEKHVNLNEFGKVLQELGKPNGNLSLYKEEHFASWVLSTLQNALGSTKAVQFSDQIKKPGTYDYKLGPNITMSSLQSIFRELAEEASFPSIASSGALEILGYIKNIYAQDPFDHDNTTASTGLISNLKASLNSGNLDDEVFEKFIKQGSQSQVVSAAQRAVEIGSSFTNDYNDFPDFSLGTTTSYSGLNFRTRSKALVKAAGHYLDYIKNDEDDFIEFTFFGITHKTHKDEMVKRIALDASLNSNDTKGIKYNFSFIKSSEFYPEIQLVKNPSEVKDIEFDLSYFVLYSEICKAIDGHGGLPPAVSFTDLVEKVRFGKLTNSDYNFTITGFDLQHGQDLITAAEESGVDIREQLENILSSYLSIFIFERLTGFPVSHVNLPEMRTKSVSRNALKMFLDGAKISPIGFSYDSNAVIDAIFENDKNYTLANDEALVLTTDESKLNQALNPTLVREGSIAKFKDPLINEDLYLIIQSVLKSNYLTHHSINEQVMAPGIFDVVLGMNTSILHRGSTFSTIPSLGDVDTNLEKDSLKQLRHGEMKIDNYRAIVKRSVTKE